MHFSAILCSNKKSYTYGIDKIFTQKNTQVQKSKKCRKRVKRNICNGIYARFRRFTMDLCVCAAYSSDVDSFLLKIYPNEVVNIIPQYKDNSYTVIICYVTYLKRILL